MINKQAYKLLKKLNKHKFLSGQVIYEDYKFKLETIDYLESLGLAKHTGNPYSQISITEEGKSYLLSTSFQYWSFLIPTIISLIALAVSIFKP